MILIVNLCYANTEKIKLKADSTRYSEDKKILIASKNVHIKYKDVEIFAPYIKLDTIGNILTSTGKITIKRGEDQFDSTYLLFDMNKNIITIKDIDIGIQPPDSKDVLFVSASEIKDHSERKYGKNGLLTSCNLEKPHYYIWSKSFDYYPNKRIIGRHTILYTPFFLVPFPVPFITLHYTPFYSYDLGKRHIVWNFPAIGKKETEGWGWFIQNTFDYNNTQGQDSSVFIDWFENKGIGLGIKHVYEVKSKHRRKKDLGSLYYYHLRENDTKKLNTKLEWKQFLTLSKTLSTDILISRKDAERINSRGRSHVNDYSAHLFYNNIGSKSDLKLSQHDNIFLDRKENKVSLNKSFNSFKSLSANYDDLSLKQNNYIKKSTDLTYQKQLQSDILVINNLKLAQENRNTLVNSHSDDSLNYYLTLKKSFTPNLTTTVKVDHFIDLDESRVTQDSQSNRNDFFFKHPEININYKNTTLTPFTLKQDLTLGRYQEVRFDNTTNKQRRFPENFEDNFSPNTIIYKQEAQKTVKNLPEKGTLSLTFGFNQYLFKNEGHNIFNGDSMNNLAVNTTYSTEHFGFIKTNTSYTSRYSPIEGNSPFYKFNRDSTSTNQLFETITFYFNKKRNIYWENKSGYNWILERYYDWDSKVFIKPNKRFEMSLFFGKKVNPRTTFEKDNPFKDFRSELRYTPTDNIKFKHSISFDSNKYHQNQDLIVKNSYFTLDFNLGKKKDYEWRFQTFFSYKKTNEPFSVSDYELRRISLVKQEHKRSVSLSYDKIAEEIKFKMTINAFPNDPIGFKKTKDVWKVEGILDDQSEERL